MDALFRFVDVRCEGTDRPYSFTLHAGETRVLQLASRDAKNTMIDCAIGESVCEGLIEVARGDRRHNKPVLRGIGERRYVNAPVPLSWQPVRASRPGRVGWVAANGGLISNLRIWENVTLPLWYHNGHERTETEQRVVRWLGMLGVEQAEAERFMAAHPHAVELWQRKLAGLLRALVHQPAVLVVDAALLGNVRENLVQRWIMALETYAAEGGAVLLVADKAMTLSWERLE